MLNMVVHIVTTGQEVKIHSGSVGFVLLAECRFVSARGCYVTLLHVNVLPYRIVFHQYEITGFGNAFHNGRTLQQDPVSVQLLF